MKNITSLTIGVAAAATMCAMLGVVGRMDYEAAREAECAQFIKPHFYNRSTDSCERIPDQPPSQEQYYAAPSKSR